MARREGRRVRLLTRRGHDWTNRFRRIADAVASFKLLIRNRQYAAAQLYAFDLLEFDGENLRGEPIEVRKHALTRLLRKDRAGLLISQPIEAPADVAFQHICQLGFEGIVSKKLGSKYESGRSSLWLKSINPKTPALQRLEQENWRR